MVPVFKRDLGQGQVAALDRDAAAEAVKLEHRINSRTVRLTCLGVDPIGDADDGIFALEVARFGEMDWTWEGARAFRTPATPSGDSAEHPWSGEIVEVDDVSSRIYVRCGGGEVRPTVGEFLVSPYEFLAALHALYNGQFAALVAPALAEGLSGAMGMTEVRTVSSASSLPALRHVWSRSWGYLWGPPGTGKTYTLGQHVALATEDPEERILVVSTTNKATDEAALSIGRAIRARGGVATRERVCRVGAGADLGRYRGENLEELLVGGTAWLRAELAALVRSHSKAGEGPERARLWSRIQEIRAALAAGRTSILEADSRIVVATAFAAVKDLASSEAVAGVQLGQSRFSSVVIDEGGLLSRAAVAALSLLAARRIMLVGDPKQLSPVSRISRVLPQGQARWIASSALHGLTASSAGMLRLSSQYRMHPDIRRAVSGYQYEDSLTDAPEVVSRPTPLDGALAAAPRAIWYVLDEDMEELSQVRAERGPGNKSWIRPRSSEILSRLFRAHPQLKTADALFVTPFVAQARALTKFLAEVEATRWRASTVHRQQGAEADVVVFDTVNASSTAWPYDEWQRLINVGMSRAKHLLIVLASRSEMQEPYLLRLARLLSPRVLRGLGGQLKWVEVPAVPASHPGSRLVREAHPDALGAQLEKRKVMRPILSGEQQRLASYSLDGKPRLVRGVAGSGKTVVLAHWLARRVAEADAPGPIWVLYANAALRGMLSESIEDAWKGLGKTSGFPWNRVVLLHIIQLLEDMETAAGLKAPWGSAAYDFEARSAALLKRPVVPRCKALFVDEAQDFGEATLAYLTQLVEPTAGEAPNARCVNIFYDNAQNLYRRGTPQWSRLGLDVRGRSTVMKESFRATLPVAEFSLNVLYRLAPPNDDPDHEELVSRDLLDVEERNGRKWWRVRFNHVHGPAPEFRRFGSREDELKALGDRVAYWVLQEGVRPGDIRVIVNDKFLRGKAVEQLRATLVGQGVRVEQQARQRFSNADDAIVVTTAQSFKGYEAEVIAVLAADKFVFSDGAADRRKEPLPASLYVAMTRARSVLYVSAIDRSPGSPSAAIVSALESCQEDLRSRPVEAPMCTPAEEHLEILERIGAEHRDWLKALAKTVKLEVAPVLRPDGSIIAEPLFCLRTATSKYACFAKEPTSFVVEELEDVGFRLIRPGEAAA